MEPPASPNWLSLEPEDLWPVLCTNIEKQGVLKYLISHASGPDARKDHETKLAAVTEERIAQEEAFFYFIMTNYKEEEEEEDPRLTDKGLDEFIKRLEIQMPHPGTEKRKALMRMRISDDKIKDDVRMLLRRFLRAEGMTSASVRSMNYSLGIARAVQVAGIKRDELETNHREVKAWSYWRLLHHVKYCTIAHNARHLRNPNEAATESSSQY